MSSSQTPGQDLVPWTLASLEELADKPGDSATVKMAKFNEHQRRQRLALQQEIEAEEQRKAEEAEKLRKAREAEARKKAEEKRIKELEAERKQLEEETRRAQQSVGSSSQQVSASTSKAVEMPSGCTMCTKAGEECKPGTGRSKSCIRCQKLKAKCDLATRTTDTEKRPIDPTSPRKSKTSVEVVDVDDGDDEGMEDTPEAEVINQPRVLRMLPPCKASVAEVLDRRLGEIVDLMKKNNAAVESLTSKVRDFTEKSRLRPSKP